MLKKIYVFIMILHNNEAASPHLTNIWGKQFGRTFYQVNKRKFSSEHFCLEYRQTCLFENTSRQTKRSTNVFLGVDAA